MTDVSPSAVRGKWVLLGFALLLAAVGGLIVFISHDVDHRADKARELESKLGRKVGPEDSTKRQEKMRSPAAAE